MRIKARVYIFKIQRKSTLNDNELSTEATGHSMNTHFNGTSVRIVHTKWLQMEEIYSRLYGGWLRFEWITTSRWFDWLHKNRMHSVIAGAFGVPHGIARQKSAFVSSFFSFYCHFSYLILILLYPSRARASCILISEFSICAYINCVACRAIGFTQKFTMCNASRAHTVDKDITHITSSELLNSIGQKPFFLFGVGRFSGTRCWLIDVYRWLSGYHICVTQ